MKAPRPAVVYVVRESAGRFLSAWETAALAEAEAAVKRRGGVDAVVESLALND